jgi:hypothetical protein
MTIFNTLNIYSINKISTSEGNLTSFQFFNTGVVVFTNANPPN